MSAGARQPKRSCSRFNGRKLDPLERTPKISLKNEMVDQHVGRRAPARWSNGADRKARAIGVGLGTEPAAGAIKTMISIAS